MTEDNIETALMPVKPVLQSEVDALKGTAEAKVDATVDTAKTDATIDLANATASAKAAIAHIESTGVISTELQAARNFFERGISWIESHVKAAV